MNAGKAQLNGTSDYQAWIVVVLIQFKQLLSGEFMRPRISVLAALVCLTGCSLIFGGPQSTVKKFMDAAKKGDVDTMNQLFSSRALKLEGAEKIRASNQQFAEMSQSAHSRGSYQMNNIKETTIGNDSRVGFHYQSQDKTESIRFVFALTKEDGNWKIDNIGGAELEEHPDIRSSQVKDGQPDAAQSTPTPFPVLEPSPAPSIAAAARGGTPISGGVLNGKAISLPKPPYPPAARAVKAAGTVSVQVLVDENGNVVSASPVAGHPLLRAAAVSAARSAKFEPTKYKGQTVKVSGVINYQFVAE
jgi:TonB family protein